MAGLITIDRARENPTLSDTGAISDEVLSSMIESASSLIESFCQKKFVSDSYTETLSGDGDYSLFLSHTPITNLTSITQRDSTGTEYEYSEDDLIIDPETGEVRVDYESQLDSDPSVWLRGFRNVEAVYEAGYSAVPEVVQEAVAQLTASIWASSSTDQMVKSEELGDWSATYKDDTSDLITQSVRALLAPYRRVIV